MTTDYPINLHGKINPTVFGNSRERGKDMGDWAGFARPIPHNYPVATAIPREPIW
jgi:hypothetical protein